MIQFYWYFSKGLKPPPSDWWRKKIVWMLRSWTQKFAIQTSKVELNSHSPSHCSIFFFGVFWGGYWCLVPEKTHKTGIFGDIFHILPLLIPMVQCFWNLFRSDARFWRWSDRKTLPSDFVSILISLKVNEDCHWLFLQLFWKKLGNFRKNIGGLCGGPITLTYKGQQTTLRPWDPSRCLDAQSISWRFRAINTLSILSRKDVRRSLEKGPCAHFATKMGRFRGLPLQVWLDGCIQSIYWK